MRKNSTFSSVSVLAALSFLASTHAYSTELAKVNDHTISLEEFNAKYAENLKYFRHRAPTKMQVLEEMIKRELGIQEAKKKGFDKDPEVQERINTVLYHAFLEKELSKKFDQINISTAEAKTWYASNPEIRTSHIFVSVLPGASSKVERDARRRIESIRDDYLKPGKMSFSEVAQKYSEGPEAPMGGDLDYQFKDHLDPDYYKAAVQLRTPGKVSDIVRTRFGFHIIKLTAIRPWNDTDKAKIKRLVFEEHRQDIYDQHMAKLKTQAKVAIKSPLIK